MRFKCTNISAGLMLFILLVFTCRHTTSKDDSPEKPANVVNIKFIDFDILTFLAVDCDKFDAGFGLDAKKVEITDSLKIEELKKILESLEPIDSTYSNYIDTRAKMEIISPKDTSYICIGLLSLKKGGVLYKTPPKLVELIEALE